LHYCKAETGGVAQLKNADLWAVDLSERRARSAALGLVPALAAWRLSQLAPRRNRCGDPAISPLAELTDCRRRSRSRDADPLIDDSRLMAAR
jgi:hypothetical protein